MDRLTDDDLIDLLGTLGVLRLEVQELRTLAQNMVPKTELENRGKRLRLAGFIAAIVILVVFVPFGLLLHQANSGVNEAKASNKALVQDQYDRAVSSEKSCNDRNGTQAALSMLIQRLLDAEQSANTPSPERVSAYQIALRGTNNLADCSIYHRQQTSLLDQGAIPND